MSLLWIDENHIKQLLKRSQYYKWVLEKPDKILGKGGGEPCDEVLTMWVNKSLSFEAKEKWKLGQWRAYTLNPYLLHQKLFYSIARTLSYKRAKQM